MKLHLRRSERQQQRNERGSKKEGAGQASREAQVKEAAAALAAARYYKGVP